MRLRRLAAALAVLAALAFAAPARADLLIQIDKSAQQMTVSADGELLYTWPVSTGRAGYNTPNGAFSPFRMDRDHFSEEWDNAPMPYSIFFTKLGHAIHGTYEARHLGQPVSHGCVRLSVKNASILWELVKQHKMANTTVVLTGKIPNAGAAVARAAPRNDQDIGDQDDDQVAAVPPRRARVTHDYYGAPRSFYDRDRAYMPPPRYGYFPFGW
jgi:hypothetical protein